MEESQYPSVTDSGYDNLDRELGSIDLDLWYTRVTVDTDT